MRWDVLYGFAVASVLAACAHREPRIVTREIRVPVAVACAPKIESPPIYAADVVSLGEPIFELVRALLIDREQRRAREIELKAALEGCGA